MNIAAYAEEKLSRVIKLTDRTKDTYNRHIRDYLEFIESTRGKPPTIDDVSAAAKVYFRSLAYNETKGYATQKQIHAALSHLNQFLAEDFGVSDFTKGELITTFVPFHSAVVENGIQEYVDIAREGHARDALVVSLLANTGIYPHHLVEIKQSDFREHEGSRYVCIGDRAIPMGSKLQEDVDRALILVSTDEVFMGKKGVLSVNGVGHILKSIEIRGSEIKKKFTARSIQANFKHRLEESGYPRDWCHFAYRYVSGQSLESVRHFEQPFSWLREVIQKIEL